MNKEMDDQRPDEEIIFTCRQHPWVLAKSFCYVILAIILVVITFLIWRVNQFSIGVLVAGLIFVVTLISSRWFTYSNDLLILTNQRIIKIDQLALFNRRVTEAELSNILNVSHEIKGPIKSLLNFGDINIDTSGSDRNFLVLANIENPHFIQEKIVATQKNGSKLAS